MVRTSALHWPVLLSPARSGPDYHAPAAPAVAPAIWRRRISLGGPDQDWWQAFPDPVLTQLEQRALRANLDVAESVEHVHAARAAFTKASWICAARAARTQYQRSKEQ